MYAFGTDNSDDASLLGSFDRLAVIIEHGSDDEQMICDELEGYVQRLEERAFQPNTYPYNQMRRSTYKIRERVRKTGMSSGRLFDSWTRLSIITHLELYPQLFEGDTPEQSMRDYAIRYGHETRLTIS